MPPELSFKSRRRGTSIVEVMIAMVILAVLVIAAGAYLVHVQTTIALQRNKRTAIEVATARLEAIRADRYERIRPPVEDYEKYYISGSPGAWIVSDSDPEETVSIRGMERPMLSTVQFVDVDGGDASYDMVRVEIDVSYRFDLSTAVAMETLVSPKN